MMKSIRFAHRDQRGITLIEMTVAVALIGLIAAGIAMTISQVMAVNSNTSGKMVAIRQVQQAGDRVSKDVLQAGVVVHNSAGDPFSVSLTIPYFKDDVSGPQEKTIIVDYVIEGGELIRTYNDDGSGPITMVVARHINPAETSFVQVGDVYIFTVGAGFRGQTETREYEIKPRPGS